MLAFSTSVFSPSLYKRENNSWWRRLGTTFCFCLGLTAVTSAQTKLWDKYLASGPNGKTIALPTTDGGYILGGSSASGIGKDKSQASRGGSDYWIVKLDANRNKVWDKTFGGPGNEQLTALQLTSDGGYILGGSSDSNKGGDKTQATKGLSDYWIVKITGNGTKVWDKTLGGVDEDKLIALQPTSEGGFIVGGSSISGKSGDKTQANWGTLNALGKYNYDYWVVKLNASGTKVWDKTLGGTSYDYFADLQQTSDGGYIIGGTSQSGISGNKTEPTRDNPGADHKGDYWLIKLQADGSPAWDKTIGGEYGDALAVVQQLSDGSYILGGSSDSPVSGEKTERFLGQYDTWDVSDYWIVKLDNKGQRIWDKVHGGSETDQLIALEPTQDGGYLLGGENFDYGVIIKLTPSGDKVWSTDLYNYPEESYTISSLQQTSDGGYLVGGKVGFSQGLYLAKLAQNQAQTITFTPIPTSIYGSAAITLSAKASSGLPVTFEVEYGPATVQDNKLTFTGRGTVRVNALQAGNATYAPTQATQTFQVIDAPAQDFRFGGSGNDNFTTLLKTQDGGYLSGGYTNSGVTGDKTQSSQGKNDYWIVKSDKNGKKLWDTRYGGYSDDYLNQVIQTQDGGYLLAGSSFSNQSGDKSQVSRGGRDYWIVKVDAQGNKQWDKRYGGTGEDELKKVIQLSSGRYILAGSSSSPVSGDKSKAGKGGQDYWILKINSDGQKVWDRGYGGSSEDILEDVALTKDGNLLLGGSSTSGANGDRTQGNRGKSDFWVLRLNSNGEKIWDKRFGGAGEDKLRAIGVTSRGTLYLAGTSTSKNSGDKQSVGRGGSDYWLLNINNAGEKMWDYAYGGNLEEELQTVNVTSDGGYLLAGSSNSGVNGDQYHSSRGGKDYWILKLNIHGRKNWDKRFGGSGEEELRVAVLTPEGFLLGGRSTSGVSGERTQPSQGDTDYWFIQAGAETGPAIVTRKTTLTEIVTPVTNLTALQAYPNPFQDQVKVNFTLPETQSATLRILDGQGREVTTLFQGEAQANQTYQIEWRAGNQVNGMYLLQLQTPTGQQTQKLLLSK